MEPFKKGYVVARIVEFGCGNRSVLTMSVHETAASARNVADDLAGEMHRLLPMHAVDPTTGLTTGMTVQHVLATLGLTAIQHEVQALRYHDSPLHLVKEPDGPA